MPLLFASAVGVAAAVLPGENERIAAFERDGQTTRALQLLEARYERGDRASRTLFDLQRLYDYYGDTDKARATLEQLAEQRPRDAVIQRQLAQLYKATQDEDAYVRALKRQISLRYSEPACKELIGIYRRSSAYDAEQAMIKQCRSLGYRRPDDLIRLAFLEASDGNLAETAQTLTAVDDRQWLRLPRERQMLFSALIETRRPEEAMRRGVRWMRGRLDADLAIDLIYKLVDRRAQRPRHSDGDRRQPARRRGCTDSRRNHDRSVPVAGGEGLSARLAAAEQGHGSGAGLPVRVGGNGLR